MCRMYYTGEKPVHLIPCKNRITHSSIELYELTHTYSHFPEHSDLLLFEKLSRVGPVLGRSLGYIRVLQDVPSWLWKIPKEVRFENTKLAWLPQPPDHVYCPLCLKADCRQKRACCIHVDVLQYFSTFERGSTDWGVFLLQSLSTLYEQQ